jgi:hypothetical protein
MPGSTWKKFVKQVWRLFKSPAGAELPVSLPTSRKSGKQIEGCMISTFKIAEGMGFQGDLQQWEHLLRIGN